jgi:hypothetical protein
LRHPKAFYAKTPHFSEPAKVVSGSQLESIATNRLQRLRFRYDLRMRSDSVVRLRTKRAQDSSSCELTNRVSYGYTQLARVVINYAPAGAASKTMEKPKFLVNRATRSSLPVKRTETFQPKAVFDESMTIAGKLVFEANTSLDFLRGR